MKFFLNKDTTWAYPEKMAEAVLVIWLASKISTEFAEQFFPEWRATRTDPEIKLVEWNIPGSGLLGYVSDICFWNRALAFWKPLRDDTCLNTSFPFPHPTPTKIGTGYISVFATFTATAILYISFSCALWTNRNWRLPFFHQRELFWNRRQPEKNESKPLLDGATNGPGESPKKPKDGTGKQNAQSISSTPTAKVGLTVLIALGWVVGIAASAVMAVLALGIWLCLLVWPVILAGLLAHAIITCYGDQAAFPCYTAFACVLAIYCAGRLCGLWMRNTYLGNIWRILGIRSLENKNKFPEPSETLGRDARFTQNALILGQCYCGCFAMQTLVIPLASRPFPEISPIIGFVPTSYESLRRNDETLDRIDAMLSYWVRSEELFRNTTNTSDFSLPEVSPVMLTSGRVWIVWSTCLAVVNSIYIILPYLVTGIVAAGLGIGVIVLVIRACYDCCTKKTSKPEPEMERRYTRNGKSPTALEGCVNVLRVFAVLYGYFLIWLVLVPPHDAVQFFLPEKYHWPGILFIFTSLMTWNYYVTTVRLWKTWQYYKAHPEAFGGEKIQDAESGSMTTKKNDPEVDSSV